MKITNIDQKQNTVIFTVEIDKDIWKNNFKKAMAQAAKNIRIEGFRPGKAPAQLVDKRINRGEVYQRAINATINEVLPKFEELDEFKNDKRELLDRPMVDVKNVNDDELDLIFAYDTMPVINLKDYSHLDLDWSKRKIADDKAVEDEVKAWMQRSKKTSDVTGRAVKKNDIAVIDFTGYMDDKEFLGGKGENYNLKIGSKQFIDNFEDQLIGMNINDVKDVVVKFPDNYHAKEYAGKPATFKVTLKGIKEESEVKFDDEFVKSLKIDHVNTTDEFKKYLKDHIQQRNNSIFKSEIQRDLLMKLIELVDANYIPESLKADEKRRIETIFLNRLRDQKTTLDKYLKENNVTKEAINNVIEQDTINSIKYALAVEKIAAEQNITVSDSDYKEYAAKLAKLYNLKLEDVLDKMKANEEWIREEMLNDRVIDYIIEINTKNAPATKKADKPSQSSKKPASTTASNTKKTTKSSK